MTAPRALFLDFDGLICDTEDAARRSWSLLYASLGLAFPHALWRRMQGRSDGEQLALADLGRRLGRAVDPDTRARRLRTKTDLCRAEPLRPGVARLLENARLRGIPALVVSSSPRDWVEPHLVRLGVRRCFADLVTGDLVERHKPAPDLYLRALRHVGLPAEEVCAFEDSPTGVRAARAAGVACVAVPSAAGDAAALTEAVRVLPSLADFSFDRRRLPDPMPDPMKGSLPR
ncbi:HAD-IA family hydrolase [Streptomyces sp. NPDC007251]|uniref:HAD family hydrolase n=1 Tax=Streptomyces sp. NPDC007251 TaxID=3154483 RepID=UPI0033E03D86